MEQAMDSFVELRFSKAKYLNLFYALLISNPLSRVLESVHLPLLSGALGVIIIGLALWFMVMTYRFSRALGYGLGGAIGLMLLSLLPLLNLIVIVILIRKYTKVTGTATNFFMFDVPGAVA